MIQKLAPGPLLRPMRHDEGMILDPAAPPALTVLTQNIRYDRRDSISGENDHWPDRAPVLRDLIERVRPDVLGTQEVLPSQIPLLEETLGRSHRMFGMGREGGGRGEHNLLFLRRERFTVQDWDQIWLSDQPRLIGSRAWGADLPRIAVWVRVHDEVTGHDLVLAVTHLDHSATEARARGAALLAAELTAAARTDAGAFAADGSHVDGPDALALPIVLMGDFNAAGGDSEPWTVLIEAGLEDAHDTAAERIGPDIGTFPDYEPGQEGAERIDWVMTRGMQVQTYAAHDHEIAGHHASDHAGVQVRLHCS